MSFDTSDFSAAQAQRGRARLGDLEVAYLRAGQGPPVVFIHGLGEDGASWTPVVARLGDRVTAYCPDLRGHGGTTAGEGQGAAAQLADDLAGFLEQVSGPAVCVGFSLGGVIVLEAALRRPDLVRKAIVVGTSSKVGRAACAFFEQRIAQLETDPAEFRRGLIADAQAQIARHSEQAGAVAARRIAAVGEGRGYANAARAMIAMGAAPITERLGGIRPPVHIVQGVEDMFCPIKAAEILRSAMPQATYSEIPGAGHLMSVDQPDLLAADIAAALGV